jgi:hypothetical protein
MENTKTSGCISLDLVAGRLYTYNDKNKKTEIYGFVPDSDLVLPPGATYLGFVSSGEIILSQERPSLRERVLYNGDFFSVIGPTRIKSKGLGIAISAKNYEGFNVFGGPIEDNGKLRYIDGCTDTLLVPPVRKGDPCLNYLHFPENITQTPHTHPSVRVGMVYRGGGECILPDRNIPLIPNRAFIIETNALHSFNTRETLMDIIAYHPDSDVGMEDDNHPMINRTLVDGVSISKIKNRHTK